MRAAVLVLGLVATALAGCLGFGESVTVPYPGAGDQVAWDVGAGGRARFTLTVGDVQAVVGPYLEPREVFPITQKYEGSGWPFSAMIDLHTNAVSHAREERAAGCSGPCEVTLDFEREGLPWGFGSSLFQGLTLRAGDRVETTVWVSEKAVRVALNASGFEERNGRSALRVEAAPLDQVGAIWWEFHRFDGTFWLVDGMPYVWSAELRIREPAPDGEMREMYRVDLMEADVAGARHEIGRGGPLDREALPKEAWDGLYPPGAEAPIPNLRMALAEAIDRALQHEEVREFRESADEAALTHAMLFGRTSRYEWLPPASTTHYYDHARLALRGGDGAGIMAAVSRSESHPHDQATGPRYEVEIEDPYRHPHAAGEVPEALVSWATFVERWAAWAQGADPEFEGMSTFRLEARDHLMRAHGDLARWEYAAHPGLNSHGPLVRVSAESGRLIEFTSTASDADAFLQPR